ncbi:MAG: hypothetical protein AUG49_10500 [Catenulispora sp. 13_1_20CM_3_70_7]|nr:MAG: hypothetical protein AUG49_10500 [Catenulispora sp. 13_1_20CM_3_70_7]
MKRPASPASSPSSSTAWFSRSTTDTGERPSRASSRNECRANPVRAAASGPVPHTSPTAKPHTFGVMGNTS